ncbi:hypothetical protein BD779DRAFT_1672636 [Infundibulicybe gibba]|nr:hypothetical protein BD779DRAFT_1672636 [Infundibulicybe gibba]
MAHILEIDLEKKNGGRPHASEPPSETSSVNSNSPTLKPKPFTIQVDPEALPQKTGSKVTRYLNYNFLTVYRKIFGVVFFVNLAVLIALVVHSNGIPKATSVANATSANLMVSLLFRQENFVNIVYEICVCIPHSLPVSIRAAFAKCSTMVVLIAVPVQRLWCVDARASLITSYILLSMFCFILASAHPTFRVKFHDHFEATHRYAGWVALVTFWTHNMLAANAQRKIEGIPFGLYLAQSPNFWTLCVSTSCTVFSWGRLRRRDVFPEILSDHAIRLHFKYKAMKPFYGLKVSSRPLLEWHAFATIPDEDENGKINGFSIVVSNAGDWTRQAIQNPPKNYGRIVVVATGSGIGPCLSLFYADVTPRRILWSTPHPESTYGSKIMQAVLKADNNAVVWNTRTQGRPDMVTLTYQLVLESQAEAVFIISNPKVTRKVVYGMETRGIPAYGAIFDS